MYCWVQKEIQTEQPVYTTSTVEGTPQKHKEAGSVKVGYYGWGLDSPDFDMAVRNYSQSPGLLTNHHPGYTLA